MKPLYAPCMRRLSLSLLRSFRTLRPAVRASVNVPRRNTSRTPVLFQGDNIMGKDKGDKPQFQLKVPKGTKDCKFLTRKKLTQEPNKS